MKIASQGLPAPPAIRVGILCIATGAVATLVLTGLCYQFWSHRHRIAANSALVESIHRQDRVFVPGEIVDQHENGSQVRILSCDPGLRGDCQVMRRSREGSAGAGPDKQSWALLSIHENQYRRAKGLPFLTGRRSDADLAQMLAKGSVMANHPRSSGKGDNLPDPGE